MDISSFDDLVRAARGQPEPQRWWKSRGQFGCDWAIVFVAGLSGRGGHPPTSEEADRSLKRMIKSIKAGAIGSFIPFDRRGEPLLST